LEKTRRRRKRLCSRWIRFSLLRNNLDLERIDPLEEEDEEDEEAEEEVEEDEEEAEEDERIERLPPDLPRHQSLTRALFRLSLRRPK